MSINCSPHTHSLKRTPKQNRPNWTWKHMTLNKGLWIKCPIQSTIKTIQACFMTTQASVIPLRASSEWNRMPNFRNVGFQTFTLWSHFITSHTFSSHSQSYKIVVFCVKSSWKQSKCILYPIVLCKSHMGTATPKKQHLHFLHFQGPLTLKLSTMSLWWQLHMISLTVIKW